ncbi:MAG: hypothetical protein M1482_04920 [Chloroflexi bacterium]|nr:hypothetical protein [Chloroflexota bacterium]
MRDKWSDYDAHISAQVLGGKPFNLTIRTIEEEEFFDPDSQQKEIKPVVYFTGTTKGLILSPTNRKALQAMFGDDKTGCIGRRVKLGCVEIKAFGRVQDVVRIFPADELPNAIANPANN